MSGTKTYKILIADDNHVNLRVLQELLKIRGHVVHAVNDGTEVMPALESDSFDLVILDCLMPGMDGFETCRAIRAADPSRINPDVPILAVTALASDEDRQKCLQAGMNDYVSKPIIAEDLYRQVDGLLGLKASRTSDTAGRSGRFAATSSDARASDVVNQVFGNLANRLKPDLLRWQKLLERFLERNEYAEIRFLAHKIRGIADLITAPELSELTAELEHAAESERHDSVAALVPQVVNALRELHESLGADR